MRDQKKKGWLYCVSIWTGRNAEVASVIMIRKRSRVRHVSFGPSVATFYLDASVPLNKKMRGTNSGLPRRSSLGRDSCSGTPLSYGIRKSNRGSEIAWNSPSLWELRMRFSTSCECSLYPMRCFGEYNRIYRELYGISAFHRGAFVMAE